jgi:hypothetical protein
MEHLFNQEQQQKASFILENPLAKLSELYSNEIKDLAIVWCYYSGKIEGNTYTYVETEALLKDGITSEKKRTPRCLKISITRSSPSWNISIKIKIKKP